MNSLSKKKITHNDILIKIKLYEKNYAYKLKEKPLNN